MQNGNLSCKMVVCHAKCRQVLFTGTVLIFNKSDTVTFHSGVCLDPWSASPYTLTCRPRPCADVTARAHYEFRLGDGEWTGTRRQRSLKGYQNRIWLLLADFRSKMIQIERQSKQHRYTAGVRSLSFTACNILRSSKFKQIIAKMYGQVYLTEDRKLSVRKKQIFFFFRFL